MVCLIENYGQFKDTYAIQGLLIFKVQWDKMHSALKLEFSQTRTLTIQMVPHCLYVLYRPKHAPSLAKKNEFLFLFIPKKSNVLCNKGGGWFVGNHCMF